MDTISPNVQSFSKFIHDHPEWDGNDPVWNGGPDSYVWPTAQQFYNGPSPQQVGNHAMVLIGVRRDHNLVTWLLLQNWWPNKQFVEVSVVYCRACNGTIWAVEHSQQGFPQGVVTHNSLSAASTDGAEIVNERVFA
jgi:hypothetical protein